MNVMNVIFKPAKEIQLVYRAAEPGYLRPMNNILEQFNFLKS